MNDDEYALLQQALARSPEWGSLVPGSGGVRKLRWGRAGRGKRGGYASSTTPGTREGVIWMLTIYAKSEEQTIPAHVLRKIREEIDG